MVSTKNNYNIKSASTERSVASLASNVKVLRNGKIVLLRKYHTAVKRSTSIEIKNKQCLESGKHSDLFGKSPSSGLNDLSVDVQNNKSIKKNYRSSKYKTGIKICHALRNQKITDAPITRSKTIKLQEEERKQLDQILIDKFSHKKFINLTVEIEDFIIKTKFFKTLGLIPRNKIFSQRENCQ